MCTCVGSEDWRAAKWTADDERTDGARWRLHVTDREVSVKQAGRTAVVIAASNAVVMPYVTVDSATSTALVDSVTVVPVAAANSHLCQLLQRLAAAILAFWPTDYIRSREEMGMEERRGGKKMGNEKMNGEKGRGGNAWKKRGEKPWKVMGENRRGKGREEGSKEGKEKEGRWKCIGVEGKVDKLGMKNATCKHVLCSIGWYTVYFCSTKKAQKVPFLGLLYPCHPFPNQGQIWYTKVGPCCTFHSECFSFDVYCAI